jgi:hypothetical protein
MYPGAVSPPEFFARPPLPHDIGGRILRPNAGTVARFQRPPDGFMVEVVSELPDRIRLEHHLQFCFGSHDPVPLQREDRGIFLANGCSFLDRFGG